MVGQTRENAARQAMRNLGFDDLVINETIKELLELYGGGEDAWRTIEDGGYNVLLNRCLEKNEEQKMQVDEEQEEKQEQFDFVLQEHEDAFSTTGEVVMDTSPFALLRDQEDCPVEGAGWLSEEDTDPMDDDHIVVDDGDDDDDDDDGDDDDDEDDDDDDDDSDDDDGDGDDGANDEMILVTEEPIFEEVEEMLREFHERNGKY